MTSTYLSRPIRDRLHIVKDWAVKGSLDWDTLSRIAGGIRVMIAETANTADRGIHFVRVGGFVEGLTGYSVDEMTGSNPDILQCESTSLTEARRLMTDLQSMALGEVKIINQRKTGELYGCHILSVPSVFGARNSEEFFAALTECSIEECPT